MINWSLMGCHNTPDGWDETSPDGVYGDVEALAQSCDAGEQGILYLLRRSAQAEKLTEFRGLTGLRPQEPQGLPSVDEELGATADDAAWE
jgi:hypothetical protein